MATVASTRALGWSEARGLVVDCQLADVYHHASRAHAVAFLLNGETRVEWNRGGRFTRFHSKPGALVVVPAGEDHRFQTDRRIRLAIWLADPHWLESIAEREWNHRGPVVIREAANNRDAEFWALGHRFAGHLLDPRPGSRLYVESLNTQLALHLLAHFSNVPSSADAEADRLTDPRIRRVIEFIDSSLGNEISLGELAELAGLSPNYFLSAFRRATGKTPHRYLTEQRVAKACEILQNPHRSIVEVSLAVGFSSQSHLTSVFRRLLKTTPAAYREEILGSRRARDENE
jgi:AraC family transcriptional regulator